MNVSTIGQSHGSVTTLPRPYASGATPRSAQAGTRVVAEDPQELRESSHLAWFDLNGDGTIEDTSPLYGGDGVLVWKGSGIKPGHPRVDSARSEPSQDEQSTPVVVELARASYSRYGQATAPTPAPVEHAEVA